jgi:hypothetical protein
VGDWTRCGSGIGEEGAPRLEREATLSSFSPFLPCEACLGALTRVQVRTNTQAYRETYRETGGKIEAREGETSRIAPFTVEHDRETHGEMAEIVTLHPTGNGHRYCSACFYWCVCLAVSIL